MRQPNMHVRHIILNLENTHIQKAIRRENRSFNMESARVESLFVSIVHRNEASLEKRGKIVSAIHQSILSRLA